jgi:hypothetical protein
MKSTLFLLLVAASLTVRVGSPANAQQAAPAILVQVAELRSMTKQAEFVGRAEALEKVDLRARVKGFLGPRRFKEGDDVKEGQVVFTIEREPFEAAVDQRKAQLVSAQATLANADQQLQRTAELARKGNAPIAQLAKERPNRVRRTPRSWRPRRTCAMPRSNSPTPRSRHQSAGGSDERPFHRVIWSGRIRVCWRLSSKMTRCRCSFP